MTDWAIGLLSVWFALCVLALARQQGWLLEVGEALGFIDDETPHWLRWLYDPAA